MVEHNWVFHGTRLNDRVADLAAFVHADGSLILRSSSNFDGRQVGVSFARDFDTARDYAARNKRGGPYAFDTRRNIVFAIDRDLVERLGHEVGSDNEIMIETSGQFVVPPERWRVMHANVLESVLYGKARAEFARGIGIDGRSGATGFIDGDPAMIRSLLDGALDVADALQRPSWDERWGRAAHMGHLMLERDSARATFAAETLCRWAKLDDTFLDWIRDAEDGDWEGRVDGVAHVLECQFQDCLGTDPAPDEYRRLCHLAGFCDIALPVGGGTASVPDRWLVPTGTLAGHRLEIATAECSGAVLSTRVCEILAEAAIERGTMTIDAAAEPVWAGRRVALGRGLDGDPDRLAAGLADLSREFPEHAAFCAAAAEGIAREEYGAEPAAPRL